MILPSQCGWWWSSPRHRVVTILACILVLSEWYYFASSPRFLFASAQSCLIPAMFECSSKNKTKNAPVVVQVILNSCVYETDVYDPGGASLSVDWGEDPTMFQYDTVTVDYETGQVITDLPQWNYNESNSSNNAAMITSNTSYIWRWNESRGTTTNDNVFPESQQASDEPWAITIRHAYTQPGRYWPIARSIGLNYNLSFSESWIMVTTCQYQDATINSGHRNESICLREKDFTRPRIDIGKDGSCSIVEVSSSSPSSGAVFCASTVIGVVGLVVAWGF